MSCPYPNCAGEGVVALSCLSCTQPLTACTECKSDNRTLARYCRNCGKPISAKSVSVSTSLKEKLSPRRLGEVRGRSANILSYGGYVWLISAHGELYKAWSGAKQLVRCATFREGGFSFPLNLELEDRRGPVIYTNNHHSIFSYSVLSAKFEKLFALEDGNSRLVSGVVKRGKDFYYLTQATAANSNSHLTLNSSGNKLSYLLGSFTLHDSSVSPLQCIGDDLWVITREKVFVFRNSIESPKEFSWNPWRLWVTSKGILYSERVTGVAGTTQSVWRLTFGGRGFEQYSLATGLSLTARLATSYDGQTVLFTHSGIEVFDAAMNSVGELTGIVQVHNPQGILLSRPFIFWFETSDRSVRAWEIGESKVYSLWSFTGETANFSEFLLSGSSLYGFTEEEVWRWDLLGS